MVSVASFSTRVENSLAWSLEAGGNSCRFLQSTHQAGLPVLKDGGQF